MTDEDLIYDNIIVGAGISGIPTQPVTHGGISFYHAHGPSN